MKLLYILLFLLFNFDNVFSQTELKIGDTIKIQINDSKNKPFTGYLEVTDSYTSNKPSSGYLFVVNETKGKSSFVCYPPLDSTERETIIYFGAQISVSKNKLNDIIHPIVIHNQKKKNKSYSSTNWSKENANYVKANVDSFTDIRDGRTYKTIKIGSQIWMSENLKYKPSDGNYWTNEDGLETELPFGYLYDWETAKKACPSGWHLPTLSEWQTLCIYLGGVKNAAGKLKKNDTLSWENPNIGATNESGFNGLPGGYYHYSWKKVYTDNSAISFWTATEFDSELAFFFQLSNQHQDIFTGFWGKNNGFPIRCVKD